MYAELYGKDEKVAEVVMASLDGVVRSMRAFRTHGKWLDLGFGQGALLDAAARDEWLPFGTELSEVAIEKGRARGFTTSPESSAFEDGCFDVVSLVELLEHVEDPAGFLREARRVLRPGGCLYVTTPNAWSVNRWFLGSAWSVFAPPDHVTIFTPPSLRRLLRQAGFANMALRAEGLNPFELVRARRASKESAGFNRVESSTRLCETLSTSPGRRRIKRLANAVLSAVRVGDSLKARAR